MTDLKGLAQREAYPMPPPTLDELAARIGSLAAPYAGDLGIDPALAAQLVQFIAAIAAGIIRESQIEHIRAGKVTIRDER